MAHSLVRNAIRTQFVKYYPAPDKLSSKNNESPYAALINWFAQNKFDLDFSLTDEEYNAALLSISPLVDLISLYQPELGEADRALHAEFVLNAMAEYSLISKEAVNGNIRFNDMLNAIFS